MYFSSARMLIELPFQFNTSTKMKLIRHLIFLIAISCLAILASSSGCNKNTSENRGNGNTPPPSQFNDVEFWLTKGDQSALLQKQSTVLSFGTVINSFSSIDVIPLRFFKQLTDLDTP